MKSPRMHLENVCTPYTFHPAPHDYSFEFYHLQSVTHPSIDHTCYFLIQYFQYGMAIGHLGLKLNSVLNNFGPECDFLIDWLSPTEELLKKLIKKYSFLNTCYLSYYCVSYFNFYWCAHSLLLFYIHCLHFLSSFSLRSTLVGVTATTLLCSFLPRSITWRTFEPSTDWTASLLVCYSLDVLPKRHDLWNIRFVTARCRRSMCVEWKENFPGAASNF